MQILLPSPSATWSWSLRLSFFLYHIAKAPVSGIDMNMVDRIEFYDV